jgi:hypothetical protein
MEFKTEDKLVVGVFLFMVFGGLDFLTEVLLFVGSEHRRLHLRDVLNIVAYYYATALVIFIYFLNPKKQGDEYYL